jgi:sulfide:quinone oxidoreductase
MANVAVIGAGLGGLPAAYELRHLLPPKHQVTLISDKSEFTFIPGLIPVALNLKPLDHVQLNLNQLCKKHHIHWVSGKVTALNPDQKQIAVEGNNTINYDYAVVATGASLAFDEVEGLGPHEGYTQSVCTPEHALTAREAWLKFLENPGPMVVGAMPGTGCFGPAYEFILMADWELRRRGLRDQVTLTYVTPEPYAGHMGVSNVKKAKELTQKLMQKRGIKIIENAEIVEIKPDSIQLADGQELPFNYSMILPAFRGVKFIREIPSFANSKGFISILPTCQHPEYDSIYALGVSVDLAQPDKTPIPIGLPKSGQMAEAMATAVAHNIAVKLGELQSSLTTPTLESLCFAEFGNTGIAYIAAPVIPDPKTGKRRYSYAVRGRWVKWLKIAFEEYFMTKMRWGLGLPWFEKVGLQTLFGLSLLKPISISQKHNISTADSNLNTTKS